MLTFTYTARDSTGKKISSELQAQDEKSAAKLLQQQGLSPIDIKLKGGQTGVNALIKRVRTKDKVIFSRQLSTLINAGLPLVQSLRTLQEQIKNRSFRTIINSVIADVEGGSAFADALNRHPQVFNHVYVSLVAAGEASGTLDVALERLANQQEKDAEIISKVRGALIYPLIVVLVMIGVVIFMLTVVLPQVENLYNSLPGVQLPLLTRVLLSISHFIQHFWWVAVIALVILGFMITRWARTGPGKQVIDGLKMHAWPFGQLFMKLYMARFSRTGTTLVASGVPLLQMLSITAEAVDNYHITHSINRAAEQVKGGKALSDCLEGDPNFLPLVPNMIRIGEQSGSLENMLEKTADYYEKEVDNQIRAISTLIEPVLMILLGIVAFMIVAAILLPIYGLVGQSGFGTNPVGAGGTTSGAK